MSSPFPDHSHLLSQFALFEGLSEDDLRGVRATLSPPVRKGLTLFKQGSPVSHLYLLTEGEIELVNHDANGDVYLRHRVLPFESFGRMEIDTVAGQLGTATTTERSRLLVIDKVEWQRLRGYRPWLAERFDRSEVIGRLRSVPYFAALSDHDIAWVADIVVPRYAEPEQVLFSAGDIAYAIYIVRQGRVRLERGEEPTRWASAGAVIGDRSALERRPRMSSAVVESPTYYYTLPIRDILELQRAYPAVPWEREPFSVERVLRMTPLFAGLTDEELRKLAGYVSRLHYHRPQLTIARQGTSTSQYYILVRGRAIEQFENADGQATQKNLLSEMGAAFGEAAVILGEPNEATVESLTQTNWVRVHRRDLKAFLEANRGAEERLGMSPDVRERAHQARKRYAWQEEGERVVFRARRHWVELVRKAGFAVLLIIPLFFVSLVLRRLLSESPFILTLVLLWVPLLLAIVWLVLDYFNDYYSITSRRVMHEEKVILLYEHREEAALERIQDVMYHQRFWGKILRYGSLRISTAATVGDIAFTYVPQPEFVRHLIEQEMGRAKSVVRADSQDTIRRQLQDRLQLGLEERTDERALVGEAEHNSPFERVHDRRRVRFTFQPKTPDDSQLMWRMHWLAIFVRGAVPLLGCVATLAIVILSAFVAGFFAEYGLVSSTMLLAGLVGFLIFFAWFMWEFLDWRNDHYIVADDFIERLERRPLWLDERRKRTGMERVQNVEFHRPGPFGFIFDYGTVVIQTAATEGAITFSYVPHPSLVQAEIFYRIERYRDREVEELNRERRSEMVDWLGTYHELIALSAQAQRP